MHILYIVIGVAQRRVGSGQLEEGGNVGCRHVSLGILVAVSERRQFSAKPCGDKNSSNQVDSRNEVLLAATPNDLGVSAEVRELALELEGM